MDEGGNKVLGLGIPELMVILVIALLIFGPKRLPEVGQNLGKAIREFKKGADSIKQEVENSTGLDENTRKELADSLTMKDIRDDIKGVGTEITGAVSLKDSKKEADKSTAKADAPEKESKKEEVKS